MGGSGALAVDERMVNDVGRSIDRGAPPSSEPAAASSMRPTASRAMRSRLVNARERRLGIRRQKRAIDGDDAEILRDAYGRY